MTEILKSLNFGYLFVNHRQDDNVKPDQWEKYFDHVFRRICLTAQCLR